MRWVFDLDNVLYGPGTATRNAFDARLRAAIVERGLIHPERYAREVAEWKNRYGTPHTSAALCRRFGLPFDSFIGEIVETMGIERLALERMASPSDIDALPGEKVVLSNSPAPYAIRIIRFLGLAAAFHEVHGTDLEHPMMKPTGAAYDRVAVDGKRMVMVEDEVENLYVPYERGWRTILFAPTPLPILPTHIHHQVARIEDIQRLLL